MNNVLNMPVQGSYEQMAKAMLQNNPALAQEFSNIMNQHKNIQNPWDVLFAVMQERGIDPRMLNLPRR
jgi:hypothetical protein